ncbi:MAG: SGNH/GDSL hydrolase family protein [Bacteroidaceae bacterium]|nr:SGNH/GDSL hydrolase family protein [Bacteroidaceae bacterium]
MKPIHTLLLCALWLIAPVLSANAQDIHNIHQLKALGCELTDSSLMTKVAKKCRYSKNRGKSVAVFGGSLSVNKESQAAKLMWSEYLDMHVTDYGHGGYGFSSLQGSVLDQVNSARKHDIYILWASTNDYTNSREPGTPQDYTEADGYDASKLVTQCGGLNYCIRHLRQLNPKATIYVFGSLPFWWNSGGYDPASTETNKTGHNFAYYIDLQRQVAEMHGLCFFDQFTLPILTPETKDRFYLKDNLHMNYNGYANVGLYQLYFLATEKALKPQKR